MGPRCPNSKIIAWIRFIFAEYICMIATRPKRNTRVSTNMPKNIRVGRSEILFIFCQLFIC